MKHNKVILENAVCNNTGDAAIMLAAVKILKAALGEDIRIDIFDSDPESSRQLYPDHHIYPLLGDRLFILRLGATRFKRVVSRLKNYASWFAVWAVKNNVPILPHLLLDQGTAQDLKRYHEADLIMTTGGTYLVEHYDFSNRILQFRLDQYLAKPLIFFTQSLGPYQKQSNIQSLKPIMEKSLLILLRDEKSHGHLDVVLSNNKSHCHVVADSVFALAEIEKIQGIIDGTYALSQDIKKVAISVREWPHFKTCSKEDGMARYKAAIAALVTKLVRERGMDITFLSTCQGLPNYRYDDSQVAQEIYDGLPTGIQKKCHG